MRRSIRDIARKRVVGFWRGWVRPILIVVIVLGSFRSAVADWNDVPSGSMRPTILEGDRIVVNKLAYGLRVPFTMWPIVDWSTPQRGDVVICFAPDTGERLVKRVVGVPGDTVSMVDNVLLVNNRRISCTVNATESRQGRGPAGRPRGGTENLDGHSHAVQFLPGVPARRSFAPVTLRPDEYFVMGDNRDASRDSRYFGTVDRRQIVGEVFAIAGSLDPTRRYLPRWERFFSPVE
ncbi:MAG: signal peptidase I [Phycisphaerae bacterium]|nr:signal peptidase I [Phycisphaerae bacterium]